MIDYDEFVKLMESRSERQSEDAEMRAYFAAFDKDNNGYIDAKELKVTLTDLGIKVPKQFLITLCQTCCCYIIDSITNETPLYVNG